MLSDAGTVVAIFLLVYLADCVVLLAPTAAVMSLLPGPLRLGFGLRNVTIRGRVPFLLNPVLPFVPAVRTKPVGGAPLVDPGFDPAAFARRGALLLALAGLQFAVTIVGLPVLLLTGLNFHFLLVLIGAYALALLLLVGSLPLRRFLEVPWGSFASLAFQSLVCLPCSANFPRKLFLAFDLREDSAAALERLPEALRGARARELMMAIEDRAADLEDGSRLELERRAAALRPVAADE